MNDVALDFNQVWKKFKMGERYDSLRDLIPGMAKRIFSRNNQIELGEREFWALKDVYFQVKRGEAIGIIGPNGAGKSTILKLLSGILRPNKGEIKVNGRLSALIEVSAGFHPDLTGRENVYLNGSILGMKRKEIDKRLDEIVEFSGISEFIDTPVKRYSSGMHARLGFSVAAHINPDILVVDEVLSVGDLQFQKKCIDKMLSLKKRGVPIVFVSHNLQSIQMLCNRAFFLKNGQIFKNGDVSDVLNEYLFSGQATTKFDNGVIISNTACFNYYGERSNVFQAGEKAIIKFNLKVNKPMNEYLLGFLIRRTSDGFLACDYNLPLSSIEDENNNINISLEKNVRLDFQVNLLKGLYTVSLHIYHNPSQRHVYWVSNILHFSVEERISWEGVSYLNPELCSE